MEIIILNTISTSILESSQKLQQQLWSRFVFLFGCRRRREGIWQSELAGAVVPLGACLPDRPDLLLLLVWWLVDLS